MNSHRPTVLGVVLIVLGLAVPGLARAPVDPPAEEESWGDDEEDDGEFEDSPSEPLKPPTVTTPSPWSLTGTLRSRWGLWVERLDDNPFAKGRQSLDLRLEMARNLWLFRGEFHGEYDLAYRVERDTYDQPTLDAYEWLIRSGEVFGRVSPGNVEVTVGRQIIAWGEGDALSPLDWINPRDSREFGLADLDDLRLPVLSTRVAVFIGAHRLELVGVHESDFGLQPSPRGPFSPFDAVLGSLENTSVGPLLAEKTFQLSHRQDRFNVNQQEVFFRWVYRGSGIDVGVQAGWLLDRQGVFEFPAPDTLLTENTVDLSVDHRRYAAVGHSGAWAIDSVLLKWEVGADIGRSVNTGELVVDIPEGADPSALAGLVPSVGVDEATILHSMIGVSWSGVTDLRLAIEFGKSWLLEGPSDPAFPLDEPIFLLRGSYSLLRQRLNISAAASVIGWTANGGWLVRADVSYEVMDGLKLGVGGVSYHPGDDFGALYGLETHDRVFAWLRWDFQIL